MNNNKQESRLGKGLSAILGDIQVKEPERKPVGYINKEIAGARPVQDYGDVLRIPANLIDPNPYQPRMAFDNDSLEELAESVRTFGLIQPISVRKQSDGRYQIISGERRFRACKLAGMDTIPAYIRTADDQGMLEMAIVENIQRQDLDPIEVAMSYQRLMDECNLTQERMSERVGKKRA
ncbi:MAG: ParB/RepB/Spo0J family partition protein, partial [Candidatus Cryptobacteroides sp.]|nr:ParB/RepB/Spo0J family partition protein [Candidatus Cryptobacteroides sp.]